jgi:hypothetical protein
MKHCRFAANNSSSSRRKSNSLRSFGISVIGRSSGAGAVLLGACLLLQGCATGSSPNNNITPPPLDPATVKIASPTNGGTVTSLPVTLSVTFTNGADPTQMKALLDGVDITSDFGAAVNGVRTAKEKQPAVNYGQNQIQIRYQQQKINSSFILDRASSGTPSPVPPGSTSSVGTLLVPIKTRVLKSGSDPSMATNWGVQVGSNTYYANTPTDYQGNQCQAGQPSCSNGYQLLLLNRHDLSVVSNKSFSTDNPLDLGVEPPPPPPMPPDFPSRFVMALEQLNGPYPGCAPAGCILVMQSFEYMGYTVDYNSGPPDAAVFFALAMENLGATGIAGFANGSSPHVAYSFIGNVGGAAALANAGGSQYERLGCSDTYTSPSNICDAAGRVGSDGNTPPGNPELLGAITGVLVRDNYNSFTYAPTAPQISYTFGTTTNSSGGFTNAVSFNGSVAGDPNYYSQDLPQGATPGFHLLILDRTNPAGSSAKEFEGFYSMNQLSDLASQIKLFQGGNSLYFLASMGKVSHDDTNTSFSPIWDSLANRINDIGGDPLTFKIFGDTQPAFDPNGVDDYLLVGRSVNNVDFSIAMPPFNGAEAGMVIAKKTVSNAKGPTTVEGMLAQDRYGYYAPRVQGQAVGLVAPQTASVLNASLLSPTPWPYSSDSGHQNAYTYISTQLCCSDIRSAYVNLNASPDVWLTNLYQLLYSPDQSGFTEDDFDDLKAQLAIEFGYLSQIRNLQNNILSLYQSQQSNVALILQQAEDDVIADVYTSTPPPQPPTAWSAFTQDVFPTLANLAGFAPGGNYVKTALGIGTLVIDSTVERTNNANGQSQLMQRLANQNVAASQLAQTAVDQYTESLISLGNDFNRIATDWGRMKAIGGPLASGQLQWDDSASGYFLRAFNLTARRQYYPALMRNSNFWIGHISYANPSYYPNDNQYYYDNNDGCGLGRIQRGQESNDPAFAGVAWYPGVIQSTNGNEKNPGAYWWDVWAFGSPAINAKCPDGQSGTLPGTFGMFDPIDQNNPSALGLWKPYFFQRSGLKIYPNSNPYYNGNEP